MPRGGKRPGAGRKFGSTTRKVSAGVQPLEVMLFVMRQAFDAGDYDKAVSVAVSAAPYVHPRLAAHSTDVSVDGFVTLQIVENVIRVGDTHQNGEPAPRAGGLLPE